MRLGWDWTFNVGIMLGMLGLGWGLANYFPHDFVHVCVGLGLGLLCWKLFVCDCHGLMIGHLFWKLFCVCWDRAGGWTFIFDMISCMSVLGSGLGSYVGNCLCVIGMG